GGTDRADGRERGEQRGEEVHAALEATDAGEAAVEGDEQQERKQHLHAGHDRAQLSRHLLEIAIQALGRGLRPRVLAPSDQGRLEEAPSCARGRSPILTGRARLPLRISWAACWSPWKARSISACSVC